MKHDWTLGEIEGIYTTPFLDLVLRAQLVHREHHPPNEVQGCGSAQHQDAAAVPRIARYCPQSAHYKTGVARTELLELDETLAAARARASRARRASAWARRGATCRAAPQFDRVLEMVRGVRGLGLEACCTLGMLEPGSGRRARRRRPHRVQPQPRHLAGVLRPDHHDAHLRRSACHAGARAAAGVTVCCGGIIGMGEDRDARLRLLQQLAALDPHPESVPINLLVAVDGTPLADRPPEDPLELVRTIATARILMPRLRPSERRPPLAVGRGAGALLPGGRQLGVPRRSPADDAESDAGRRSLAVRSARHASAGRPRRGRNDDDLHAADVVSWPLRRRVDARMRSLDERGLCARFGAPAGIDLASNDYLGLANHPSLRQRLIDAVAREGVRQHWLAAAARRTRGFTAVEARFARFKGTDRSLYFSSGYLANLAVLTTFAEAGDVILSDERNHASLIDGIRLSRARREFSRTTTSRDAPGHRSAGRAHDPSSGPLRAESGRVFRRCRVAVQHGRR